MVVAKPPETAHSLRIYFSRQLAHFLQSLSIRLRRMEMHPLLQQAAHTTVMHFKCFDSI
jgi:hypothetical protein